MTGFVMRRPLINLKKSQPLHSGNNGATSRGAMCVSHFMASGGKKSLGEGGHTKIGGGSAIADSIQC